MENIQYLGEHILPGRIGHFALLLGFVASLLSCVAYFFANQRQDAPEAEGWLKIGRASFLVHGAGIFAVIGVIFFLMINQYYEYQYVQAHVSEDLPFKYIFSAFWEGQEGSFLLWMFWHIVLGMILIGTAGKWEAPVLSVLSLIEVFIGSMLLGLYIGLGDAPAKIGSNPLMLLRDVVDAPIFANADYVSLIQGSGLNPLLQNYWMTIHPPTLFLGFASTSIPFCFAIAGLWTGRHKEWLKPAMPWALFSGAILGTGILMGGAWAYEALSFGGYWAWDPVENMSLVPWLILLAGIHTNLIARSTGYSIRSTYVFYLLTFLFILYSTFLTRSGVLGETSVHAFTEMGLEWQLVLFMAAFFGLSLVLMAVKYRKIPAPEKEEPLASKEFWMFIGTLVLLFSALIITASTSLPVYNKIVQYFDPTFEGKVITDPEPHYNKYQLWIAVFIGLLSGLAQYLRWKGANWKSTRQNFAVHTIAALIISAVLTYLTSLWVETGAWQYLLLLYAGIFTVVANVDHLILFIRGNLKLAGSSFSHIGFGLMIVGIIASGLNKRFISSNPFVMDGLIEGADEESLRNNILLFKNSPMLMGDYEVTYLNDTVDTYTRTYHLNFKRRDTAGKVIESFDLYPNILYDKTFTKVAASNPSTKRYLDRDIFTHIASLPQVEIDMEFRQQKEAELNYQLIRIPEGQAISFKDTVAIPDQDTFHIKRFSVEVAGIVRNASHPDYKPEAGDFSVGARLRIRSSEEDSTYYAQPVLVLRGELLYGYPVQINELNVKVKLNDGIFDEVFTPESQLGYQEFELKQGETINFNGLKLQFAGFNKEPSHPNYEAEDGDIAVSAMISAQGSEGGSYVAQPLYFIRGNKPFNLKDEIAPLGLHFRFTGLNPQKETAAILIAQKEKDDAVIPVEIAANSLRSDYIVLEAIEFPGINFFWLGAVLMMVGLAVSMWHRISSRRRLASGS